MFNSGTGNLTLTDCTVSGNSCVSGDGGGVFNAGTANLTDCTLSGNSAGGIGGGVFNAGTADPDRLHRQRQLRRQMAAACSIPARPT